jgi:hypothetical protein
MANCRLKALSRRYTCAISCVMRPKRNDLAIVACILSAAALGYGYLSHHLDAVDAFDWLWIIWFVIAQWLGGRWWGTVNLPVSGIYQEAKRGSLRLTGMALMIERAAFACFGATAVSWLIAHQWL